MGLEYRLHQPNFSSQDLESEGCSLAENGDFTGAIQCFKKVVAEEGGQSHAPIYEMMAQCMMENGETEEAVAAASNATQCDPQWQKGFHTLARAQRNNGELQEALRSFHTCLDVGRDSASLEEMRAIKEERLETESLLQREWADRIALPQLCIRQNIGDASGPGCVVWESGIALAEYMSCHLRTEKLRGRQVLELGSGTGIAGIAVALLGAHVVLTDQAGTLTLLQSNVDQHAAAISEAGGSARIAELSWERPSEATCRGPYSLVIGADLVYAAGDVQPLLTTLSTVQRLNPACALLMAHCARSSAVDERLFEGLRSDGCKLVLVAASEKDKRVKLFHRSDL